MLIIKILIVIVILFLLRRHIGVLKPSWPLCVGLTVGGLTGWWLATLAVNTGVDFSTLEYFGCPRWFIKPIVAVIGALMMVGPISAVIWSLFPPNKEKK